MLKKRHIFSCYRSMTITPTLPQETQEAIMNSTISGCDRGGWKFKIKSFKLWKMLNYQVLLKNIYKHFQ